MHAKSLRVPLLAIWAIVLFLMPGSAQAKTSSSKNSYKGEIYPLGKVKRGQKGYGMTTMQGTTPERFEFEVIGVNHNFLPKMDIILVKSDDPKVQVTGFWQGMSGSPMYIDGKLVCAFSYGFRFNKLAIGGCTPLEYMKAEGFQRRRGSDIAKPRDATIAKRSKRISNAPQSAASLAAWLELAPNGDVSKTMHRDEHRKPWLLQNAFPKRAKLADSDRGMQPSAVPLALSGFSAPAFAEVKSVMKDFPVAPMQAGGTGNSNAGPRSFQMGGAIAVQLVRGDMSAASTGTVSYIDGEGVLAFGHPMFHAGEVYAPVAAAEIHTVIPSAQNAFIVSSPLRELGSLTQDRQSTIAADTSIKVGMIPMHIRVREAGGNQIGDFDVEILDSRFFTATFASIAASNATSLYLPDRDHVTLKMKSKVEVEGFPALEFEDFLHSSRGADGIVGAARGLRVISPLMNNPFGSVPIKSIDLDIEVSYDTNTAEIVAVSLPKAELEPGKKNHVDVLLKPYQGKEYTRRIPFDVPENLEGSIVRVDVTAGDAASLYVAPPESVSDLVKAFRSLLPGTVFAVTVSTGQEAAAISGRLIEDLPASAMNRLRVTSRSDSMGTKHVQSRSVYPASTVVEGEANVLVKVGETKK